MSIKFICDLFVCFREQKGMENVLLMKREEKIGCILQYILLNE